ncbi:hypothetical protein BC829DRAFT_21941 [Chytridium lagenaria]|nr:hypothetical protein BC829DRAFT_21941 [Chytridium lagenaria]
MRSIQVRFSVLFQVYFSFFENKTHPWNTPRTSETLIRKICAILNQWYQEAEISKDFSRFPVKSVDDAVSKLLLGNLDDYSQRILRSFQDKLRSSAMTL